MIVGLTGNYGMGKSTVAELFRELGARVIDTDEIVRALLSEKDIVEEIGKVFGDDFVAGGEVNRKALAETVFSYPHMRLALENILHPRVFKKVEELTEEPAGYGMRPLVIVEATVIFERGYQNRFDRIITVRTAEETARARLEAKGIPPAQIEARMKSQFPVEMKARLSDFVIDNDGGRESTRQQVAVLHQRLTAGKN